MCYTKYAWMLLFFSLLTIPLAADTYEKTSAPSKMVYGLSQVSFDKGLIGGLNNASMDGSDLIKKGLEDVPLKHIAALSGGAFFRLHLRDNTISAIQFELTYSLKGVIFDLSDNGMDYEVGYRMKYLDIPTLFLIELYENLNIYTGPSLGIYLSGETYDELSYQENDETMTSSEPLPWDDIFSPNLSVVIGATYDVSEKISFHVRYEAGLTSIIADDRLDIKHKGLKVLLSRTI